MNERDEVDILLSVDLPKVLRWVPPHGRDRYREEWSADILGAVELGMDPWLVIEGAQRTVRQHWLRHAGDLVCGRTGLWPWLVVAPAVLGVLWPVILVGISPWQETSAAQLLCRADTVLLAPMGDAALLLLVAAPWSVRPSRARAVGVVGLLARVVGLAFFALHADLAVGASPGVDAAVVSILMLIASGGAVFTAYQLVLERRGVQAGGSSRSRRGSQRV